MLFNNHSDIKDLHSFLSPSNYHWMNYTPEKLEAVYRNQQAKEKGTILHAFASMAINERIKLANHRKALNLFVNDSIGYKMTSEQVLFYSRNAFGTADAISFKDNFLRIFDLKTGITKPSFKQLVGYVALFCLEYDYNPEELKVELRMYQGNGFEIHIPDPAFVRDVMEKIVEFDVLIENIKRNG